MSVEVACVVDKAIAAVLSDRSPPLSSSSSPTSQRTLHVWDRSCLRDVHTPKPLSDLIPLYTLPLGSEPVSAITAHVYDIDHRSLAIFVAFASAKTVQVKKLFVSKHPISRVEAVHEFQQTLSEAIVGMQWSASKESCQLLVWSRAVLTLYDDDLDTSIRVALADYMTQKSTVAIASCLVLAHPFPLIVLVLKQGVLLVRLHLLLPPPSSSLFLFRLTLMPYCSVCLARAGAWRTWSWCCSKTCRSRTAARRSCTF